ncbi:MAG: hypothetical protein LAO08_00080 [Acidobacteriia bacterium]|nr:hypothetical protein [Terriglobia bacterium]
MSNKKYLYMPEDKLHDGGERHLEFKHAPEFPYPFPILPEGTRDKHDLS